MNHSPSYPDLKRYSWLKAQLEDLDSKPIRKHLAEHLDEYTHKNQVWHQVLADTQGTPLGVELKHHSQDRYVLIIPDASNPGEFRAAHFAPHGFTGHITRKTVLDVLDEVIMEGFTERCDGAMTALSSTDAWKRGTEQLEVITAHNHGQISHDEFVFQMQEIAKRYESEQPA